ncbi:dihydroxyacetone kinase [Planoprotostelium fungivorum]|uniref:Dihydroxyacetone kinase n=1 Tax=Planoprotostelium fungivorum TaxID=1890364 RepID=A0A2P6NU57_9EUKA|nr:dihydroxyacetone kinase [Planoprotostelium fungivorum]
MSQLINSPQDIVPEMIDGLLFTNKNIQKIKGRNVIIRKDRTSTKDGKEVALISGGGSGHEPSHAGFVGKGMLSAAVLGDVFSSPTPMQVLSAIRAVTGPAGCLLIVKNYTGDRLNFGMAAELARNEGYEVAMVIVGDDCALLDREGQTAGRRGIAGTLFVHKILGALAESGEDLESIRKFGLQLCNDIFSAGFALSGCTLPGSDKPIFQMEEKRIEMGLGIHGESGRENLPLTTSSQHARDLVDIICQYSSGDVAIMINNLGSTTNMEMYIFTKHVVQRLISRIYCGAFMTALDMHGVSLSVVPGKTEYLRGLDHPIQVSSWPIALACGEYREDLEADLRDEEDDTSKIERLRERDETTSRGVVRFCEGVIDRMMCKTQHLSDLDALVGDGDLGSNLEKAGRKIRDKLDIMPLSLGLFTEAIATILADEMGGTSGVLYTAFFLHFSRSLQQGHLWAAAFEAGCGGITDLGGAKEGDRTMMDALLPAVQAIHKAREEEKQDAEVLKLAADAAQKGADKTKEMQAKKGRSSYLGSRAIGHPDPGAQAIADLLKIISDVFNSPE